MIYKELPESISKLINGKKYSTDKIGFSGAKIMIFEDSVLKIFKYREENNIAIKVMKWLEDKIPVPKVISYEKDKNYQYLLMTKIKGKMSCDEYYLEHPDELVTLLAKALKMLWNVNTEGCPYNRDLDVEISDIEYRVNNNLVPWKSDEIEIFGENYKFTEPR